MKKRKILCLICLFCGLMLLLSNVSGKASGAYWHKCDDAFFPESVGTISENVEVFENEGTVFRAMLINGKIIIESLKRNNRWREIQSLESDGGVPFVSLALSDHSELIAGTADPGFLYIYDFNDKTGKWNLCSNSKYLWSAARMIVSGKFEADGACGFLTQSAEGNLFYFKQTEHSPNLVWKSLEPRKYITDTLVIDIDGDNCQEILAFCKDGEMLLLKVQNYKAVSCYSNYVWGKVLGAACGDWDGDGKDEIVIASSQKIVLLLKYNEASKTYSVSQKPYQHDFTIEKLFYSHAHKQWFMSDLSGVVHIYEYSSSKKQLQEVQSFKISRINSLIASENSERIWYLCREGFMGCLSSQEKDGSDEVHD